MLATYESEQRELQARTDILEAELADLKEKVMNVNRFLKLVDEYTEITELTADIARRFIEKVVVHESEYETYEDFRHITRRRKIAQEIHIHYVCIDEFILK